MLIEFVRDVWLFVAGCFGLVVVYAFIKTAIDMICEWIKGEDDGRE